MPKIWVGRPTLNWEKKEDRLIAPKELNCIIPSHVLANEWHVLLYAFFTQRQYKNTIVARYSAVTPAAKYD